MPFLKIIQQIPLLHQTLIESWKASGVRLTQIDLQKLIEENHAFNYQLWHAEDRARRDDKGAEFVYLAKREIDGFNQERNNRMEAIDQFLYESLKPAEHTTCPVHSETPGMMIDRLSILALKAYHMALQTHRAEASPEHRAHCQHKLSVIHEQQAQLQSCLEQLFTEVQQKIRTFRVYRQFKMYNDPNLNPELYSPA